MLSGKNLLNKLRDPACKAVPLPVRHSSNIGTAVSETVDFMIEFCSPNIVRVINSRRLRWAGHVPKMEEDRSALNILTGKSTRKRPLGRPRRRWEDILKLILKKWTSVRGQIGRAHV